MRCHMTVSELIEILKKYKGDEEVHFEHLQPGDSAYTSDVFKVYESFECDNDGNQIGETHVVLSPMTKAEKWYHLEDKPHNGDLQ